MAKISKCTEVVRIVNEAVDSGAWHIVAAGGTKHDKLKHISGHTVAIPGTPGDRRASMNFRTHVRHVERGIVSRGFATCAVG